MENILKLGQLQISSLKTFNDGGVFNKFLSEIKILPDRIQYNRVTNINFWLEYSKHILFNSTRYTPTNNAYNFSTTSEAMTNDSYFNVTLPLSVFLVLLLLLLIGLSFCSIYICATKNRIIEKKSVFKNHKNKFRTALTSFIVIFGLIWFALLILVCINQLMISDVMESLNSTTNKDSNTNYHNSSKVIPIASVIKSSIKSFVNFGNKLIIKTYYKLETSLKIVSTNVTVHLEVSLQNFANKILKAFKVTDLFIIAKDLSNGLKAVTESMNYIAIGYRPLFANINLNRGRIDVYQNDLQKNVVKICDDISDNNLQLICNRLKDNISDFRTRINTSLIKTDPSVVYRFLINALQVNISEIISTFDNINKTLNDKLGSQFETIVKSINISRYLNIIPNIWQNFSSVMLPVFQKTGGVLDQTNEVLKVAQPVQNTVLAVLITSVIILIVCIAYWVTLRTSSNLIRQYLVKTLFCQILLILLCLIVTILATIYIIVPWFISTEVCSAINQTSTNSTNVIDSYIDLKLSEVWPDIVSSLGLSKSVAFPIQLDQPKQILHGLTGKCRDTKIGLLDAVGVADNLINITQLLYSPEIQNIIKASKNESLNELLKVGLNSIIPNDELSFFNTTREILKYFDNVDYKESIRELKKPLTGLTNLSAFFVEFQHFTSEIEKDPNISINTSFIIDHLKSTIDVIKSYMETFSNTQTNQDIMRSKYVILQQNRNNSEIITALLNAITVLKQDLSDPVRISRIFYQLYDVEISGKLIQSTDQLLTRLITNVLKAIIECNDLSIIYDTVLDGFCRGRGFSTSSMTFGLLLIMFVLLSIILAIVTMTMLIINQITYEENVSKC